MVRRLIAASLAAALVILSPGLDAGRAFAAVVSAKVAVPGVSAVGAAGAVAVPGATALSAVSLAAPSSLQVPVLSAPADAAMPAASVPAMAETLAPALQSVAEGRAGAAADRGSAQQIEDVITGARSIAASGDAAVLGGLSAGVSGLSAAADAPAPATKPAPQAPKAAPVKVVTSRAGYALHRKMLALVASLTGAVHSMPAAGPALTERAIKAAAGKRVVISDYDDTLAAYNQTLSAEMIDAVRQVKAAGKHFAVISDRGDEKRAHQLTVFESLATLPVDLRAGMYVAANSGGRVYRYDALGEPVKLFEIPALEAERKAVVAEAAEATKARLAELGAEQHVPSEKNNNPSESWNTYGYAMMLKVGSSERQVRGAAEILQEELAKRGIEAEVQPRFAKDPANPPYINFSIVTKQPATEYIAKALKASADEVALVGDSMYVPHEAKKAGSWLDRIGERLAGRAMPKTGNATDRNMEKALPGALTIAVGHNADPRMSNAWVTDVKGPEATRRMLLSVASKPLPGWGGFRGHLALEEARLKALHQAAALAIPGARGVEVQALQPYGMGHDSFAVDVLFDDIEAARQAVRQGLLPKDLPEAADGSKVFMVWKLPEGTEESYYRTYEDGLKRDFAALPGAVGAEIKEYMAHGHGVVTDRALDVYFQDEASLDAARKAGKLPKRVVANDELPTLRRVYEVFAKVGAPAPAAPEESSAAKTDGDRLSNGLLIAGLVAAAAAVYYLLGTAFVETLAGWERMLRQTGGSGELYMTGAAGLGFAGVMGSLRLKRDPADRVSDEERAHHSALKAIAGVEKVSGRRAYAISPAGSGVPMDERVIDLYFKDMDSLNAARASGALPASLPSTMEGVKSYSISARLTREGLARRDEAERATLARIPGVLSVSFSDREDLYREYREVIVTFRDAVSLESARAAGLLPQYPLFSKTSSLRPYGLTVRAEGKWERRWREFQASRAGAFAAWLLLAGLTIGLYAAIFWVVTHAPAAPGPVPPEGWTGPLPGGGWEDLFR